MSEISTLQVPSARPDDSVELAYSTIRESILTGKIPPGAIISQVTLARELGTSRTPLREALSRLAGEGLVRSDFNQRMRVSDLDLDDFDQIYAVRLALEPIAIRATVSGLDDAMRQELVTHVDAMDDAIAVLDIEIVELDRRAVHSAPQQPARHRRRRPARPARRP